jgi:hypothetical protein
MRETKANLYLECVLTEDELKNYSKQMADSFSKRQRAEDSLKSMQTQMKAEIQGHEAKMNLCAEKVNSGKEYRDVECEIVYNWDKKEKEYVRKDTGEIAKTEIIDEKDLQEHLDL